MSPPEGLPTFGRVETRAVGKLTSKRLGMFQEWIYFIFKRHLFRFDFRFELIAKISSENRTSDWDTQYYIIQDGAVELYEF